MIEYTFKIDLNNGEGLKDFSYYNLTYPFIGFSDKTNINEELDSGYIEIISENFIKIPIFSYIEYTITNATTITKCFYVGSDNVEKLSKSTENKRFLHKIDLIEITKKMEKYPVETICFTKSQIKGEINYTLWDVLQRVYRIYEIGEDISFNWDYKEYETLPNPNKDKIISKIDENLKNYLSSIEAPTFVFNNLTLREIFNEVFNYVNAIATFNSRYELSCEFYNKLKREIERISYKESFVSNVNVENYSTNIQSFIENQISDNSDELYSIVYPSSMTFDRLKTRESNYSLNDSNFGILLNFPIYELNDILTNVVVRIVYHLNTNYETQFLLSLKDFIVEEQVYNNLPYSTSKGFTYSNPTLTKNNTIYYRYKDNFVNLSNSFKSFLFEEYPVLRAMWYTTAKKITQSWEYYKQYFTNSDTNQINLDTEITIGYYKSDKSFYVLASGTLNIPSDTSNYKNFGLNLKHTEYLPFNDLKFRTEYKTIHSTRLTIQKNDISDNKVNSGTIINQGNRIVSLQNISNNMKSTIERIGNYEYLITIRHKNIYELIEKGWFLKDENSYYVCVEREVVYFNDYVLAKYLFTKNFNRLSEFIGINSQIRQYQIPSGNETYERMIRIDNYCYLSLDNINFKTNKNSYILPTARKILLDFFESSNRSANNVFFNSGDGQYDIDTGKTEIEQYWNSLVEGSNTLLMECSSEGTKDALIFNFGFNDNICAGYIIQDDGTGSKKLMTKVAYTNNKTYSKRLGFLRNCALTFTTPNIDFNTDNLPLTYVNFETEYTNNNILFDIPDLLILKDSAEILKFCFQINFINKSENDLIIGNGFGKYNRLVYNGTKKFHLYYSESFDRNNVFISEGVDFGVISKENIIVEDILGEEHFTYFTFNDEYWGRINSLENANWISIGTEKKELLFAFKHTKGEKNKIYLQFSKNREDIIEKY